MSARRTIENSLKIPRGLNLAMVVRSLLCGSGTGLYLTGSAIFFTRYIGLSASRVGLGLSIAWAFGMMVRIPAGRLADKYGGLEMWLAGTIVAGLSYGLYPLAHGFASFVAVMIIETTALAFIGGGTGRYFGELFPDGSRSRGNAFLKAATNAGMAIGTLAAGIPLAIDTRSALLSIIWICAGVAAVDAVIIGAAVPRVRVPRRRRPTAERPSWRVVFQDKPFIAAALLNGIFGLYGPLLSNVLPLWILRRTDASPVVISGLLLVNSLLSIMGQVPASRNTEDLPGALKAQRRAAAALAACCGLFAMTEATTGLATVVFLVAATIALTVGELLVSASSCGIRYKLAPKSRSGEYLALFSLGNQFSWVIGPAVLTGLIVVSPPIGWVVVGIGFLIAGVASGPVLAWAERTRREEVKSAPELLAPMAGVGR